LQLPAALGVTGVIPTGLVNTCIVHGRRSGRVKIRGVTARLPVLEVGTLAPLLLMFWDDD